MIVNLPLPLQTGLSLNVKQIYGELAMERIVGQSFLFKVLEFEKVPCFIGCFAELWRGYCCFF